MVICLPAPYPDELLYSVLARYHVRSGNSSYLRTTLDLFGSKTVTASFYFPTRLNTLVGNLPVGSPLTVEEIIDRHSILPYYQPFIPPERVEAIKKEMVCGNHGVNIFRMIGQQASSIPLPSNLLFCPKCLHEDLERYGEAYWHRVHQLAGIIMCPKHEVTLLPSEVGALTKNAYAYLAASPETCPERPWTLVYSDKTVRHLVRLAQMAQWLLEANIGPLDYQARYQAALQQHGYITKGGSIRVRYLVQDLRNTLGDELLSIYGLIRNVRRWAPQLLRYDLSSFHPIRHLLFILFLSISMEEFVESPVSGQRIEARHDLGGAKPKRRKPEEDELVRRRRSWQELRERYPDASKSQLRQQDPATYDWLKRHDFDWLVKNVPEPRSSSHRRGRTKEVDWSRRDLEILERVRKVVAGMLEDEGRPVKVSLTQVMKRSGYPMLIHNLDKLPKTKRYLEEILDTAETFQKRRIRWAVNVLREGGKKLNKTNLLKTASLPATSLTKGAMEVVKDVLEK
ncbi:MAG: TnsD family transposase [Alicyclobacillus macrosporangiidus]|uniref:TnsD family Tn7-like transposition protein n=1 Tax=Alicyclobacillus macrosporangiidus TaxID=392015 RepID=UPI0026ECFE4D|nr:TnsD family Tn7-like transposition protein [Alicyclobacillus macrosporangiidus]MCL6598518.1 TnsD family transposase [Alicyclobacillus macrosporangiidus]